MRLHLWQSPSSEVTFILSIARLQVKYIVVRKFMKKQCVAAPVAKKQQKSQISFSWCFFFNGIFFFIFPILYISKKEKTRLIVEFFPCVVLVGLLYKKQTNSGSSEGHSRRDISGACRRPNRGMFERPSDL